VNEPVGKHTYGKQVWRPNTVCRSKSYSPQEKVWKPTRFDRPALEDLTGSCLKTTGVDAGQGRRRRNGVARKRADGGKKATYEGCARRKEKVRGKKPSKERSNVKKRECMEQGKNKSSGETAPNLAGHPAENEKRPARTKGGGGGGGG